MKNVFKLSLMIVSLAMCVYFNAAYTCKHALLKGARELNTMHELINVSVAVKTKWQGSSSQLEMIVIIPST